MIEVKNLVKRYGDVEAVRDVSFTVQKGMIYGFLGPNGAGKSTTMNIITGTLAATEGEVTVNGCDIYEDPIGAKSAVGYLPEQPPLYPDMTPNEYLAFVGEARGLRGDKLWDAVDRAVEKTGLGEYADRLIKNLSKGYRQRVGIAQAILADPEIVILDEPTVGLDPRQIIEIRELIRRLGRDHTVILSSHILTEISAVCDYVIIIAHGRIVASDTLENLTKRYEGKNYIDLTVRGDEASVRRAVESIPGVGKITVDPKPLGQLHVRIAADSSADIREDVFFRFADARMPILSMEYEEVTLEKVFLELTGEKADSEPAGSGSAPAAQEAGEVPETAVESEAAPAPESAPAEEPAPAKPQKPKKSGDDDDYTPLFGG
ncbi:MAG: ABC transporter ATP-binding protein [Clostridia bacterium]|nr:ABC transporter ATP-binding protein [Clostridia bacterium]